MVLVVGDHDPPAVQQRERVAGPAAGGGPGAEAGRTVRVEVPDHDRDLAQPVGGEVGRQPSERVLRRRHERLAEDEVLHRVPGQHHLRERHELRPGVGGLAGPAADRRGVAGEITDRRVDLGEGEA